MKEQITSTGSKSKKRKFFNPFPGLRPFNIQDSHLFFGREGQSDELLKKLADNRFVSVIGASGSGKSSLMFCGLVPTLQGGFITEAGSNWKIITTRPGGGPIENLASALVKTEFSGILNGEEPIIKKALTQAVLRNSSRGLIEAVKQLDRTPDESILLLVDQFEELFRFKKSRKDSSSANESAAFVKLLLEAVKQKDVPIYVVLTMRSDFIGDCSQFPDLTQKINDSHYLIPQMTRANLQEAITGPVAVGNGKIASRLVQQLLNDVGDNPDQLPILQHALMRTWNYWIKNREADEPMDIDHYEAIGKMEKALSEHANEAYDELSENGKKICEALFKTITEKGSDSRGTRHPEQVSTIAAICLQPQEEVVKVIEGFRKPGRSLLTPSTEVAPSLTSESIVDISHESLMRIWDRLKAWVEEEANSVQLYQRLSEAASMYQLGKTSLWRPPDLLIAQNWKEKQQPALAWAQRYNPAFERTMVFLDTSIKEYETEEQNKIKLQKRTLKRAKIVTIIVSTAAIISLGLMVYAFQLQSEAEKQREEADKQKREAEYQTVEANKQKANAEEQQKKAEEQKIIAEEKRKEADKQKAIAEEKQIEADRQKAIAEGALAEAKLSKTKAEQSAEQAKKAQVKAEQSAEEAKEANAKADKRRMQAIAQSMAVKAGKIDKDTNAKALVAYQAYLFNDQNDGKVHNPDIYDGLYYALKLAKGDYNTLNGHQGAVRSMTISSYSSTLYSTGSDGKILKWDYNNPGKNPEVIADNDKLINRTLAISSNSQWMACGSDKPYIQLYTLTSDKNEPKKLLGHKDEVMSIAFTPDNKHLISGSLDSTILMWDMTTFTSKLIEKCSSKVNMIAIAPDGKTLAGGTDDGKVFLWNLDGDIHSTLLFEQKKNSIISVVFNNNGTQVAVGDQQGIVRIMDVKSKEVIASLVGYSSVGNNARITDIRFSPDGKMFAASCFDGSIQFWLTENYNDAPIVLREKNNIAWIFCMEFTPDGSKIIAGYGNNLIKVYSTRTKAMAEQICTKLKRNMSQKEWNDYVGSETPYQRTCPNLPAGEGVTEK